MRQIKQLSINATGLQFKEAGAGEPTRFSGYASVFNVVDGWGDRIMAGAYAETLGADARKALGFDVAMLKSHDMRTVIGKWITLKEDERGLWAEGELTPGHSAANDTAAQLKHHNGGAMSVGIDVLDWSMKGDVREITRASLWEISVTAFPANPEAKITEVKERIARIDSLADAEDLLREAARFSKSQATEFVTRLRQLVRSDSADQHTDQDEQVRAALRSVFRIDPKEL